MRRVLGIGIIIICAIVFLSSFKPYPQTVIQSCDRLHATVFVKGEGFIASSSSKKYLEGMRDHILVACPGAKLSIKPFGMRESTLKSTANMVGYIQMPGEFSLWYKKS